MCKSRYYFLIRQTKSIKLYRISIFLTQLFLYKSLDHPSLFGLQPLLRFTNPHDYFASAFQTLANVYQLSISSSGLAIPDSCPKPPKALACLQTGCWHYKYNYLTVGGISWSTLVGYPMIHLWCRLPVPACRSTAPLWPVDSR